MSMRFSANTVLEVLVYIMLARGFIFEKSRQKTFNVDGVKCEHGARSAGLHN